MLHLPPMDVPAVLHRRVPAPDPQASLAEDVIVAQGPLIIMAYGFLAAGPRDRDTLWISSPAGNLMPSEIEEAVRRWHARPEA